MKPQIIVPDTGYHNQDLTATISRLKEDGSYADLSCVVLIPAFGTVPTKVLASWWNSYFPPNQVVHKIFAVGFEVGEAFSRSIEMILEHPVFSKCRFIATLEHDNVLAPDTFVKLLSAAHQNPEYSVISGLYATKGPGGVFQCWGDPKDPVLNYRPQLPRLDGGLLEVCGTGMGAAVWRMDMFRDERLRKPWFVTTNGTQGMGVQTQDLYFASDARRYGYRFAVHCGAPVGHHDHDGRFGVEDFTW